MQEKRNLCTGKGTLILIWVILLVLSLLVLSILASFFAGYPQGQTISSLSWAGYTVEKDSFPEFEVIGISAAWVVPRLDISVINGSSSAWIGIGGELDKTLIQVGTEHDVTNDQESYSAWYELLPSFAVHLTTINVAPGDIMSASINLVNPNTNNWNIQISDITNGQTFNQNFLYNSTRSSGEWIVERPTVNNKITTLSNFGTVTFANCRININDVTASITKYSFERIRMTNNVNTPLASVSTLTNGGSSFNVNYVAGK